MKILIWVLLFIAAEASALTGAKVGMIETAVNNATDEWCTLSKVYVMLDNDTGGSLYSVRCHALGDYVLIEQKTDFNGTSQIVISCDEYFTSTKRRCWESIENLKTGGE